MEVSGFKGKRLVNSFHGGDNAIGALTSPSFKIERKYISFLIGGGGFEGKTCMNLIVGSKVVRTATGQNTKPGGHELLEESRWDVADLAGQSASLQIVDNASGGWGHILVDQIVFTDTKPPTILNHPGREIVAERKYLNLPVQNGASVRKAALSVDGQPVREFTIECADGQADWWAAVDISAWRGKTLKIEVDKLPEDSSFLASMEQGDSRRGLENLYGEAVRPQFHFSPSRGWNNDPNGLCFFNGEYHLFFQLNPYGVKWGNMHWGHAVSTDLMHWKELDIALYPDALGPMFSGSAVVDWKNTSGLGSDGKPPLVLIYTAADNPSVQCLAYSTDGRQFTKLPENPIVEHIRMSGGNRDPKVIWHEPTHQWVMALYMDYPTPAGGSGKNGASILFLTSPNLKTWSYCADKVEGFYECPDMFALPVDGDAKNIKWVLTAASSEYMIGGFDGRTFLSDGRKLRGHRGRGFYAAQTFSDLPASDGRRIQIGWLQTPSPKMPFNQSMSVPLELKLLSTFEGPRLARSPVKELEALRVASKKMGAFELKPEAPLAVEGGELLDVRLEFDLAKATEVELNVRGVSIRYDVPKQELAVNDLKVLTPLRAGKQTLIVLADRNSFEIFARDGLTYVPLPFIAKDENRSVVLSAKGGAAKITAFDIHQLKSIWKN